MIKLTSPDKAITTSNHEQLEHKLQKFFCRFLRCRYQFSPAHFAKMKLDQYFPANWPICSFHHYQFHHLQTWTDCWFKKNKIFPGYLVTCRLLPCLLLCVCFSSTLKCQCLWIYNPHILQVTLFSSSQPISRRERNPKISIGIVITLFEEGEADKMHHFQSFFFSHFNLIEGHFYKLSCAIEKALTFNKRNYIPPVMQVSLRLYQGEGVLPWLISLMGYRLCDSQLWSMS